MFSHTVGPGRNQSTSFPPEISVQLAQSRRCFCQPASRVADISVCVQKGGECLTARRFWFLLRGRAGFSVWKSFPDDGREKKKKRRRDNMRVACLTAEPPQRPINHASYRCNEAPRMLNNNHTTPESSRDGPVRSTTAATSQVFAALLVRKNWFVCRKVSNS